MEAGKTDVAPPGVLEIPPGNARGFGEHNLLHLLRFGMTAQFIMDKGTGNEGHGLTDGVFVGFPARLRNQGHKGAGMEGWERGMVVGGRGLEEE